MVSINILRRLRQQEKTGTVVNEEHVEEVDELDEEVPEGEEESSIKKRKAVTSEHQAASKKKQSIDHVSLVVEITF